MVTYFIFSGAKFLQDVVDQKLLKSVDFYRVIKNKISAPHAVVKADSQATSHRFNVQLATLSKLLLTVCLGLDRFYYLLSLQDC